MNGTYPATRLRRTRATAWSRAMHREVQLSPADFIWPLFVTEGRGVEEQVSALPGVSRWSVDLLAERAREAVALGIPCLALFPNTQPERRSEDGREALNPDNLMCRAIRAIRDACGDDVGLLTDVALDPYTSHGQDGLIDDAGYVLNDATVEVLVGQSLNQAAAGADIIAPSDMMDGRIGAVRRALDERGFDEVIVMSYAAKYASGFYGPFRDIADCAPRFGDRAGYQMDPANAREALREVRLDLDEGADIVMVKPALAYLDIIRAVRDAVDVPVAAYNVSGEYAMLHAAARNGWLDLERVVRETLLSIRRAGADLIVTYHARDIAHALD
jgi:porphobilinogen synthase